MGTCYNHRIWLVLAVSVNLPLYKYLCVNHLINHKQMFNGVVISFSVINQSIIMKRSLVILALTLPFLLILVVLN
jgi:hypothetical protein